uniref:Uncharacterized protein n=1 Tax=Anguilla anguilla TaxID=7936 RepID=A0A0E9S3D3_ANGAN
MLWYRCQMKFVVQLIGFILHQLKVFHNLPVFY